jgi:LEA14-like dessication related protein
MIDIRDLLFSTRRRAVLALCLLVFGAVGAAVAAGVLGVPSVSGVDNRFAGVNDTTTTIESTIHVENPNPLGVTLGGVTLDYAAEMNEIRMAEGRKRGVAIRAGESNVTLTTHMKNEKIPAWWVSHVRGGEHTDLTVHARVRSRTAGQGFDAPTITRDVDTDVISQFNSTETRAIRSERPLAPDPIVYVNETSARWGPVTDERTPIRIAFVVYNPNSAPIAVSELGYDVSMNAIAVGNGTTEREYVVPPKSTRTLRTTVYIENGNLDEWWVSHLERNQITDLRIDFHAKLDVGSGGTVRVPLDPLTYERTIETDIFGTKGDASDRDASATSTPTADSAGSGGDSTTTDADGSTTDDAGSTTDDAGSTTDDAGSTTEDGLLAGGDGTATPGGTAAPTPETASETATETTSEAPTETTPETTPGTTTDDGGLLGV